MASPKSYRPKAPGERPSSDGNPQPRTGGQTGQQKGKKTTKVPKTSPTGPAHAGNTQSGYSAVPTNKPAPSQAGSPGFVKSDEAQRKGGTRHQFPNGSE